MTGWAIKRTTGAGLLALCALATGCACRPTVPTTTVVLLPQADGSPSSLVVTANSGQSTVVGKPFQTAAAVLGDRQAPRVEQASQADIQRRYGALLSVMPAKPERFTLYFKAGSTELTAESRIALFNAIFDAQQRSGAEIAIVGHTDTTGSAAGNDRLSQRRAEAVHALLSERGFTRSIVDVRALGEREPAVPTGNYVSEPRNRRVEIIVR